MRTDGPGTGGQDGTAEARGVRAAVERWSARPVLYLHGLPRGLLLAAVFVLLVVGMWGSGWVGAAGLLALFAGLGWFAYLNWPALEPGGRALRVAALAVLLAFAAGHVFGRF
ncbi:MULTISPECIES: DUF6703 family protein [Actinomadura]|uniref:DUF6703 family protein n=1 Tax=Actinomadura yumaensis TaxID=111807 RepID=A0ABW2CIU6_9ACTN|nr:DUF6703 family protein [Actinomadura sp. J1-007]MWK33083.1 hypothetical protein [Actinomadura sp. J1-007]